MIINSSEMFGTGRKKIKRKYLGVRIKKKKTTKPVTEYIGARQNNIPTGL